MTGRLFAVFLCSLPLVSILAPEARAELRTETVRWTDELNGSADVTGYRIYYGLDSRDYTGSVDAGLPPVFSDGVIESTVEVPAGENIYIAVTAYNEQGESLFSNEICRTPLGASCADSSPGSDTSGGGAQAAIEGFALWDAGSDTLLDSAFQSGEQISLEEHGACVAIEIRGNSYLDEGRGSIGLVFDGETYGGCTVPGLTHENHPPYAWEADQGPGTFACAASLTELGPHTLAVTPYDGADCTGAVGSRVTLEFEVVDGGPLGPPGQPALVAP